MKPINIFILLLLLLSIFTQVSTTHACTNFCLDTPDGPVFGCNLDLFFPGDGLVFINQRGMDKKGFSAGTTGRTAEWVSNYGSVTFNLAVFQTLCARYGLKISSDDIPGIMKHIESFECAP